MTQLDAQRIAATKTRELRKLAVEFSTLTSRVRQASDAALAVLPHLSPDARHEIETEQERIAAQFEATLHAILTRHES